MTARPSSRLRAPRTPRALRPAPRTPPSPGPHARPTPRPAHTNRSLIPPTSQNTCENPHTYHEPKVPENQRWGGHMNQSVMFTAHTQRRITARTQRHVATRTTLMTRGGGALTVLAALLMSLALVLAPATPAHATPATAPADTDVTTLAPTTNTDVTTLAEPGTYAEGSAGFFRSIGATAAANAIATAPNNSIVGPYQNIDPADDQSAFNLDNMLASLSIIERCNQIRAEEGLPALLVDPYLMAVGQINANYSSVVTGHSQAYNVGENVAWGYPNGASAFEGWYTAEKNLWLSDSCAEPRAWFNQQLASGQSFNSVLNALSRAYPSVYHEVGHYLNIINPEYGVTGAAQTERKNTYEQAFYFSGSTDDAYDLAYFQQLFNDYYTQVTGKEPGTDDPDASAHLVSIVQPEHARIEVYNNVGADFDGTFPPGHTVAGEVAVDEGYELKDLVIEGPMEYVYAPYDNVPNTWVFRFAMPANAVTISAEIVPAGQGGLDPDPDPVPGTFSDVLSNAWYYDAVEYVAEQGIMNGQGTGETFGPLDPLGRSALAQLLYNMADNPEGAPNPGYADSRPTDWYYKAVSWAAETGSMTGYNATTFGPSDAVTREQLVTVIWRLEGQPASTTSLDSYPDAGSVSTYAADAMAWAVGEGIISGSGGHLDPGKAVDRCTAATIIARWHGGVE